MVFKRLARATEERHFLSSLLGYRWLSLLPLFLALFLAPAPDMVLQRASLVAVADNLVLTLFHPQVNRWVKRRHVTLAVDLTTVTLFVAVSGGTVSHFYLYAPSPLLAAAFFSWLDGALIAASTLAVLYAALIAASTLAVLYAAALAVTGAPVDLLHALSQINSSSFIGGTTHHARTNRRSCGRIMDAPARSVDRAGPRGPVRGRDGICGLD